MAGIKEKISNTIDKMMPGQHNSTVGNETALHNTGTDHLSSPVVGKHSGTAVHGTGAGPLTSGTGSRSGATTSTTTARTENLGSTGAEHGATGVGHGTHTHDATRSHTTTGSGGGARIPEKEIIDSKTFTKTVDEEVLIEKKTYELEHRPRQEEYVVETRKIGERRVPGAATDVVGTEAREVQRRDVAAPRGDRTVIVEGVDVPASEIREGTHVDKHPITSGHHQQHA